MTSRSSTKIGNILRLHILSGFVRYLLRDEAISGKLIIVAIVAALICANTFLYHPFEHFWTTHLGIHIGAFHLHATLRHWVNEGLMVFFFLMVCLEIKRELVLGELRKFRSALLPIGAAFGGMALPALLYIVFNADPDTFKGWAIPMSTDTALAVGLLTLLGNRIPSSLKLFLLTLAVVDDIGAVTVIAIFYGHGFNIYAFSVVVVLGLLLFFFRRSRVINIYTFALAGVGIWLALNASGIHASVTGAILGLLAPVRMFKPDKVPFSQRVEKLVIPIATLFVVPLFAFANAGVVFTLRGFGGAADMAVIGIIVGLVVGKLAGIAGASFLLVRLRVAKLPDNTGWAHIIGIGLLAGIGFTVAIFVTELAFGEGGTLMNVAKISILVGSVISAALGLLVLRFAPKRPLVEVPKSLAK